MAQGDRSGCVDLVVADAEVSLGLRRLDRPRLDPGAVGLQGRAPAQGAVGADRVVVVHEGVELGLKLDQGLRGNLPLQVALQRLVQALDLAAGLGVVGTGVLGNDPGERQ